MGAARCIWDDIYGYAEIKHQAKLLANHDVDILIIGETGTGKRLFAEAIHNGSSRKDKPFVTIEIPCIPTHLFESELFGHKRGAFTDAREDKVGLIESANSGTVFIDEIGDLPLDCQVKLLRVIEEKAIRRVGENAERKIEVRFIFATNKDLWQCVSGGSFREDLLFRISKHILEIPPLRKRQVDLPEIAEKIWQRIINSNGQNPCSKNILSFPVNSFTREELNILLGYHFPGNVRQLEGLLERVFLLWPSSSFNKARLEIIKAEIESEKNRWAKNKSPDTLNPSDNNFIRLFNLMTQEGRSFWEVVHKSYLKHEISREDLKKIIRLGLEKSGWSFKGLLPLFNIREGEYKKFLNFLQGQRIKIRELINI
ncbi:MAG: sigma 54-interacting transcriptional regulator [Candidatus Saccharicenans sp.]